MEHLAYWLAISRLRSFSVEGVLAILSAFGSLKKAWESPESRLHSLVDDTELVADIIDLRSKARIGEYSILLQQLRKHGIEVLTPIGNGYPPQLRKIPRPPASLFIRGNSSILPRRSISIVGTREPSEYGMQKSHEIAHDLAKAGYVVVSGLAYGIDTCAHEGALQSNGHTVAVLASYVNDVTPKGNVPLAERIIKSNGALVSEYTPTDPVTRANFVRRNRVVAGLAEATIIIEGTIQSGTRHQANFASELGRYVFVLDPEDESSEVAELPLLLMRQGATPIRSAYEVQKAVGHILRNAETEQMKLG